jgi:hypothetical protein
MAVGVLTYKKKYVIIGGIKVKMRSFFGKLSFVVGFLEQTVKGNLVMSKKCDRCGAVCSDAENFCTVCGTALSQKEEVVAPQNKGSGKRIQRLKRQQDANIFSANLLLASFIDGDVFYAQRAVWSEILVAVFPILAYVFMFLHIGLDKLFLSYIGGGKVLLFVGLGIAYGLATVLLKAGAAVGAGMIESKGKPSVNFFGCVRSVGLSHCIPMVLAFLGVIFRLIFSWSSLTFGIAALLINLYPYYTLLEARLKNKYLVMGTVTLVGFIQCLAVAPLLFAKFV